jgi:hypothetical protein
VPLQKGGILQVPDQVMVSAEGITFVRPGEVNPTTVSWQNLDLAKLAKLDAQLEAGRQKALLTGEKTLVAPEAPGANPYAAFLEQPVKVTFRAKETHQTRVESASVFMSVPPVSPGPVPTGIPGAAPTPVLPSASNTPPAAGNPASGNPAQNNPSAVPQQILKNSATVRSDTTVDQTRKPLDTTIEGLFELISDASQSSSGNLLRELREQPHIFTNILNDLRTLQALFPTDRALPATADAIQKLAKNGPVSVDAQNALRRTLATLRARSKERVKSR